MSTIMRGPNSVSELKDVYDSYYLRYEKPEVKRHRELIEGYFITGTTSEEDFLAVCDYMDCDLYDDYKDMYEEEPWYIDLQHYTENLQRITGKKPSKRNKEWMYLKIQTEQD